MRSFSLSFFLFLSTPRIRHAIRSRKRPSRERETCPHTLYLQIHVGKHTHSGEATSTYRPPRKFNRSVHLHARLFPIPRTLPPFGFNQRRVTMITGEEFSLFTPSKPRGHQRLKRQRGTACPASSYELVVAQAESFESAESSGFSV